MEGRGTDIKEVENLYKEWHYLKGILEVKELKQIKKSVSYSIKRSGLYNNANTVA